MSITLFDAILHQLTKDETNELNISYRDNSLLNDDNTTQLITSIHQIFQSKASRGFATFAPNSQFQTWLEQMLAHQLDFQKFSRLSVKQLKDELSKYPFADEGIVIFATYQALATDYLFIGLLPINQSLQVTKMLDVSATQYLDLTKMDIAARIDLSSYQTNQNSNRYLSYIKGRVGRKIADFFLDFMQAQVGLDVKEQNTTLMRAVNDYCADANLDKEETNLYKKQIYSYCNEQLKSGDELQLDTLSQTLPTNSLGVNFKAFTRNQGYDLAEEFPADRSTLRKLTKFVGGGGGLNISFDSTLLGERIFYDPQTDTLTITGTPPNLKDQLLKHNQG